MFNDIDWSEGEENSNFCFFELSESEIKQQDFRRDDSLCLGPGDEEKWYGTHNHKPEGQWNSTVDVMVQNFEDNGDPVFRASSALDRGYNAEFLLRTLNSANQLSIYGAVADWCHELAQQIPGQSSSSTEESIAKVHEQLDCPLAPEEVNTSMTTLEAMFKHRVIDCVITKRNSKIYRKN